MLRSTNPLPSFVPGPWSPQQLVDWLNKKSKAHDHRRIERLMDNITAYVDLGWRLGADGRAERPLPPDFVPLRRAIIDELSRYAFRPELTGTGFGPQAKSGAVPSTIAFGWDGGKSEAAKMILLIMELGREGFLWRIRRCRKNGCRRWFYAIKRHQTFCSRTCQQADYWSSPEWREHRRKYMRNYREAQR